MGQVRDPEIRKVLLDYLEDGSAISLNEVGICKARTIIDVLHVDDKLNGYEIKGDSDNLLRLPRQIEDYSKVCDTCTIVVGSKHLHAVEKMVPSWWGIHRVHYEQLEVIREAQHNETVDRASVIELIWKEEAKDLLKKHKAYHGMSTFNKRKLHRAIYENVPYGYVHEFLLERMRDRQWGYGKIRRYE